MEKTPVLRVITVAYNSGEELLELLATLQLATTKPYETVIVDNGQDATYVDRAADYYGAKVLNFGRNLGYGSAMNRGAEGFEGEWILIVNPDLTFRPGAIDALIEESKYWPRGGIFGPRILTPEGEVYPSARRFPTLVSGIGHAALTRVWPANPFTKAYRGENLPGHSRAADWLSGSCMLVRREAFEEVGGFDESYFMFFEDTQLCRDLREKGWRSVYVPAGIAVHDQGLSWRARPEPMIRAHHASARNYVSQVYAKSWQAPIRAMLKAGLKARESLEVHTSHAR